MASISTPSFLGSLSVFPSQDETTHIGTSFPDKSVQLSQILRAPNSDELIKDLAILTSQRCVVWFRDQDLTIEDQRELGRRMGELSGKPKTSTLHKHPVSENTPELGGDILVISSVSGISRVGVRDDIRASNGWHADITFEPVPSDYAILKMHTLPPVGGDTLWASGYEAYDRLSPAFRKFLEGLTAVHDGNYFIDYAKTQGIEIQDNRGSPENIGTTNLTAVHPVIRTNPVTGFKSIFVNRSFTTRIVELTPDESDNVLQYLYRHIAENHDLQVRFKWNKNDIAIWDNRSAFHTATNDYEGHREGNRVVSIGEKPFFDPNSKSRREALGIRV
ncbi:taurine catabolism dioxygenase [Dendrothele bispora CBS 962.96]|uniref:Taurine catabolism dioxygenase n=1 Tax=Dendrothele bispora (strain CBS 962.96) TaxID=1314807 RepID=A0A4S8LNB0_DENBC|nr:taurine catabolism dioxygenase [Dendrothele bispora CBS 962.96]